MKILKIIFPLAILYFSCAASAGDLYISAFPEKWRLQNYSKDNVTLWYTGSPCNSGQLTTSNLSLNDKKALYATVLSAKLTSSKIYIFFSHANGRCEINSFGMDSPK